MWVCSGGEGDTSSAPASQPKLHRNAFGSSFRLRRLLGCSYGVMQVGGYRPQFRPHPTAHSVNGQEDGSGIRFFSRFELASEDFSHSL
jgi:hypothetical protein